MPLLGLKLGLGQTAMIKEARRLWADRIYDFIEIYIPLDANPVDAARWDWYDGLLALHAPHSTGGFNFARPEMMETNRRGWLLVDAVRKNLRPAMVIFHPGVDGTVDETVRQAAMLAAECPDLHRIMLIENKPKVGLGGEDCLGASPEEMRRLLAETGCGFCLDARHAFAYAAWAEQGWRNVLGDFLALSPRLWHAADGFVPEVTDSHRHFGDGDMPWREIARHWRADTPVTIECGKDPASRLADFLQDLAALRAVAQGDAP